MVLQVVGEPDHDVSIILARNSGIPRAIGVGSTVRDNGRYWEFTDELVVWCSGDGHLNPHSTRFWKPEIPYRLKRLQRGDAATEVDVGGLGELLRNPLGNGET